MKIDILKHTLVNVKKSITFWMWKVEKKFFSKILDNLIEYKTPIYSIFWDWYWILVDRWYDDKAKFELLMKLNFNFVIRLKSNRNVYILEWKKCEKRYQFQI